MVRAFVAIDLTEEIRNAFLELQEPLRGIRGGLRVVDPALLHMTLKFLGDVSEEAVPRIVSALQTVSFSPYEIHIGRISSNSRHRPRVIWADVDDDGRSAELAGVIEETLEPLGFAREKRPFRPHITVTRVKTFHPAIPSVLESLSSWEAGSMEVSRFFLKKSTLTPEGPIYETMAEVLV